MKDENIINILATEIPFLAQQNHFIEKLSAKLLKFKMENKAFALVFQPGAGAPVVDFLQEWMNAGLGGCTGELCAIADAHDEKIIVINSMSHDEQDNAPERVKNAIAHTTVFNDTQMIMAKLLAMNPDEVETVNNRKAYKPQTVIYTPNGEFAKLLHPNIIFGEARKIQGYIDEIQQTLSSLYNPSENISHLLINPTKVIGTMFNGAEETGSENLEKEVITATLNNG